MMPIYELTKSELCDLYEYQHEKELKDRGIMHQFSVSASTDNRAKFIHRRKRLTIHISALSHIHVICGENVDSGPKHALPLHPPLNFSHIGRRVSTLHDT